MKQLGLGFLAALITLPAGAAEQSATYSIKQVISARNTVILQQSAGNPPTVGDLFIVHLNDGKQCSLKVKSLKAKLIATDSSDCPQKDLSTKLTVEPSLADNEHETYSAPAASNPNSSPSSEDNGWGGFRWAGKVYYAGSATLKFEEAYSTGVTGKFDAEFETGGALGLAVSYTQSRPYSWGFGLNVGYETAREFKKAKLSNASGTGNYTVTNAPKLSLFYIDGEVQYRWQDFYLPFGLGVAGVGVASEGSGTTTDVSGGVGIHFGMGYFFTESLSGELNVRSNSLSQFKVTSASGVDDFGKGSMASVGFGLKYFF